MPSPIVDFFMDFIGKFSPNGVSEALMSVTRNKCLKHSSFTPPSKTLWSVSFPASHLNTQELIYISHEKPMFSVT